MEEKPANPGFGWMIPYLALAGIALGLLSWLVGSTLLPQLPLWAHAVAILAALLVLAVTLYALGRAGMAGGDSGEKK